MVVFCVAKKLKIVGGKGVCILGYAKFLVAGMQLDRSRKLGTNAFAYPFAYPKLGVCMFFFYLQRWPSCANIRPVTSDGDLRAPPQSTLAAQKDDK
jgi:hypothetical protein